MHLINQWTKGFTVRNLHNTTVVCTDIITETSVVFRQLQLTFLFSSQPP